MMGVMLIGTVALLGIMWWVIAASRKTAGPSVAFTLPSGTALVSVPLITETELSFYNLLQMAVQDRYLIFTHVPLWSFVSVEAMGKTRSRLLKHMALKRVDFVLVHPGSRHVELVVQIEEAASSPYQAERHRVIELLLDGAGIKLVKVRSKKSYTIPELTTLLGFEAEE